MRFLFRVAGVTSVVSAAMLFAGSVTAYADANPDNRGHHYGQLKHHQQAPPPSPAPTPAPKPPVTAPPASQPAGIGAAVSQAATDPSVQAPVVAAGQSPVSSRVETVAAAQPSDPDLWLLLLILPTLMAVWLIALAGLARGASRLGRRGLQAQAAPA